jgi:hypothetical protein
MNVIPAQAGIQIVLNFPLLRWNVFGISLVSVYCIFFESFRQGLQKAGRRPTTGYNTPRIAAMNKFAKP